MAKKKVTQQSEQPKIQEKQIHQAAMGATSEKLENLKSLNSMLLKETVERRQQVDALQISNGSLESELTRSKLEKAALQTELTQLSDSTVLFKLQTSVVSVFVSIQVSQQAEAIVKERDGFGREGMEMEKKLGFLEREMMEVMREKSEIERVKREKECEIRLLKKRLSEAAAEIEHEKQISCSVSREKDEIKSQHEDQVEETNRLGVKLIETEKKQREIEEVVCILKAECKSVLAEKEERESRLESLKREKDLIERCLAESNQVIEEMKREIGEIIKEKEAIEEEKNLQVVKRTELQNRVSQLGESVLCLQKEEEKLKANIVLLEKEYVEVVGKEKEVAKKIDALVEEKKADEKNFNKMVEEKGLIMRDLDKFTKQLDEQKKVTEAMGQEKIEVERAKIKGETELGKLKDNILSLDDSCRVQIKRIKQLESEVRDHKDELHRVKIERDEAQEGFEKEKMDGINLRDKMVEKEKNLEETNKLLIEMKNENGNLIAEAHKKKCFWTLVSSATTILAATSVAYVARGH